MDSNLKKSIFLPICETEEEARERIYVKHQPFVWRDCDVGPCVTKWNVDYLTERIGGKEVKVHVSESRLLDFLNRNFIYRTIPFNELLKRVSRKIQTEYFLSEGESYYLRSVGGDARKEKAEVHRQFPGLADDLHFPPLIPYDQIFSSVFRVASAGVSIWTHYDIMDNMLIQVVGRKRALLFPPGEALNLYLNGDKSEVLDVDHPNLEKFPRFQRAICYEGILEPGDILYIPALWFHNMKYLEYGVAVNVFWKELDNAFYDKKDPYGNKDHLPAQKAFMLADKALASLSELPEEYAKFYIQKLLAHITKKTKNSDISD